MLHRLKEKLYELLEEYAEGEKLSGSSLQMVHMITDTIKNIDKIEMLEEEGGHSRDGGSYNGGGSYDGGASYGRRGGGMHYVRGHYSRDGGGYSRGGYSRGDGKQNLMYRMEEMLRSAENERQREALQKCMEQLERIE